MPTDRDWLHAPGAVRLEVQDGVAVLRFEGEIDINAVNAYETAPDRPTRLEGQVLAVDAAGVTFFSASSVSFLMRMTEGPRSRAERPIILGASRALLRVLQLTGLDGLFA